MGRRGTALEFDDQDRLRLLDSDVADRNLGLQPGHLRGGGRRASMLSFPLDNLRRREGQFAAERRFAG